MGVYRDLLLSTGGGVIGTSQKDVQNNSATIAIGLGGTGVACLRNLKRQIYDRVQPDKPDETIPTYNKIRFLAVDSDKNSLKADEKINSLNESTEFFKLSTTSLSELLKNAETTFNGPEYKWLKTANVEKGIKGIKILSAKAGAGGVRQVGRLLMMQKSADFVEKLQRLISSAIEGTKSSDSDVNIHVFTGMGGGTGSGIFLDTCYLIREAVRRAAPQGEVAIFGYFFLPDVNLSIPEVQKSKIISDFIQANGFAAMKELDYCMNFEDNGGSWNQQYQGFHIGPDQEPPVDIAHLISAQIGSGEGNGFDYAMNVVSDFVMQFVIQNEITMESHISNYRQYMTGIPKQHGANNNYCLLGASNAIVPIKEITTYLASKFFDGMSKIGGDIPSDDEIDVFAKNIGLKYEQLKKELLAGTSYQIPDFQFDYKLFLSMPSVSVTKTLPATILSPIENFQEKMVGTLTKNMEGLTTPWSWEMIHGQKESTSKVCQVYEKLAMMVSDASKGPQYAAVVLNGSARKNLVTHLRGELSQINEERENCQKNIDLRFNEMAVAQDHFLNPGMFEKISRKKLFEKFMASVRNYYTDLGHITMLDKMEEMVNTMIPQFETLEKDCFAVYAQVIQDLISTFELNYKTLNNAMTEKVISDPFIISLMSIKDLKHSLDGTIKEMNLENEKSAFHSNLFANEDIWKDKEEKTISKAVSDYLLYKFNDYTRRNIDYYLQTLFNTDKVEVLADRTEKDILENLVKKAKPLFKWGTTSGKTGAKFGYCSIPQISTILQTATGLLVSQDEFKTLRPIKSGLSERISLLQCVCGASMVDYAGVTTCGAIYKQDQTIGKHLYEKAENDERDWRTLFNLVPYSANNQREDKLIDQAKLYDEAVNQNIIRQRPEVESEYQLVIMPNNDEFLENVEDVLKRRNKEELIEAKKELQEIVENMEPVRLIAIKNDGMAGYEDQVRKDYVLASAENMKIVTQELEKKQKLKDAEEKIDQVIKEIAHQEEVEATKLKTYKDNRQIYFDALMTGVITFKGKTKLLYTKVDEFGLSEEMEMSISSMQPFGSIAPIYQGFKTFSELSEEERQAAADMSNSRKDNVAPEITEAIAQLQKMFTSEFVGAMQAGCKAQQPEEEENLKAFLRDFLTGLKVFASMYGE